ncbi:MAG: alpha/beta hydrolase [Clostridiales bacterium]|nr:alpha/beta hydrolase [Clostridiales bacterium]
MIEKWNITVPGSADSGIRSAYIYLPDECMQDEEARYPVLYMFDGHNVFFDEDATYGKSWGMKEYMDATRTPLIIAAVECSHSPDHGRLREYSPYDFNEPSVGKIPGEGKATMDWLTQTFKPYIDEHFPTIPDREHTFIAGSSMGGLMSLYAVLYYNDVFSGAAALSPALGLAPAKARKMIQDADPRPDTVLYMNYGSLELGSAKKTRQFIGRIVTLLLEKGILLSYCTVPGGEHCEASWEKQIPFFVNTLLYE